MRQAWRARVLVFVNILLVFANVLLGFYRLGCLLRLLFGGFGRGGCGDFVVGRLGVAQSSYWARQDRRSGRNGCCGRNGCNGHGRTHAAWRQLAQTGVREMQCRDGWWVKYTAGGALPWLTLRWLLNALVGLAWRRAPY